MDSWLAKHAAVAPFGILTMMAALWTANGGEGGLEGFAGFTEMGVVVYAAFLVVLDYIGSKFTEPNITNAPSETPAQSASRAGERENGGLTGTTTRSHPEQCPPAALQAEPAAPCNLSTSGSRRPEPPFPSTSEPRSSARTGSLTTCTSWR